METDNLIPKKSTRRWYQYSLRTLMIFVTIFAVACSWFTVKLNQAGKQREVVEALAKIGCHIGYDFEVLPNDTVRVNGSSAPKWLQNLIGKDFFCKVTHVIDENGKLSDTTMVYLRGLPDLQSLHISDAKITDEGLEALKELTELRSIHIWTGYSREYNYPLRLIPKISDVGLANLKDLKNLISLQISGTKIRGDGLDNLAGMEQLEELILQESPITDAGMSHIKNLKQLRGLYLMNAEITDVGLDCLKELTQLQELKIPECPGVSDAGVKNLQKALPKLKKIVR